MFNKRDIDGRNPADSFREKLFWLSRKMKRLVIFVNLSSHDTIVRNESEDFGAT